MGGFSGGKSLFQLMVMHLSSINRLILSILHLPILQIKINQYKLLFNFS